MNCKSPNKHAKAHTHLPSFTAGYIGLAKYYCNGKLRTASWHIKQQISLPPTLSRTLTRGENKARGSHGQEREGRSSRCWSERELMSVTAVETEIAAENGYHRRTQLKFSYSDT
jgi:hypothetical protein